MNAICEFVPKSDNGEIFGAAEMGDSCLRFYPPGKTLAFCREAGIELDFINEDMKDECESVILTFPNKKDVYEFLYSFSAFDLPE